MTKRLIAPGITGSVWRWELEGSTSIVLSGGLADFTRVAVMFGNPNHATDARFLAGSKRVAEAAAKLCDGLDSVRLDFEAAEELRAALISQGYSYSEQE